MVVSLYDVQARLCNRILVSPWSAMWFHFGRVSVADNRTDNKKRSSDNQATHSADLAIQQSSVIFLFPPQHTTCCNICGLTVMMLLVSSTDYLLFTLNMS